MESEYSCSVTLMFLGDDLDPAEVTEKLSLPPSKSWRKGEKRFFTHSDGTTETLNSRYEWGGWKKSIDQDSRPPLLEEQLQYWLNLLGCKEPEVLELTSKGIYGAMDVFICTKETASLVVPVLVQSQLSHLGLELRLSFQVD